MADENSSRSEEAEPPEPAEIEVGLGHKTHRLSYERAFVFGCQLMEKGLVADAASLIAKLEKFKDRGPRAFIMQAFCEAATEWRVESGVLRGGSQSLEHYSKLHSQTILAAAATPLRLQFAQAIRKIEKRSKGRKFPQVILAV